MTWLATIHAPPLSSTATTTMANFEPLCLAANEDAREFCNTLVILAEQHASLFQQIQQTLDVIRILSSRELGLGPCSPYVGRIEHKMIANERVSFARVHTTMRRNLMRILLQQHESLQAVVHALMGRKEMSHASHIYDESCMCTLRVLDSLRRENKSLLSEVLSMAFETVRTYDPKTSARLPDSNMVQNSIALAEEHRVYLESVACMDATSCENLNGNIFNSEDRNNILVLQKHLCESRVLLWAFLQSTITGAKDETSIESMSEQQTLWKYFSDSLKNVVDVHECLGESMFPTTVCGEGAAKDDAVSEGLTSSCSRSDGLHSESVPVLEWKTEGHPMTRESSSNGRDGNKDSKTMVFSGKGLKWNRNRKDTFALTFPSESTTTELIQKSKGQGMLLRELQSRLSKIKVPEEMEVQEASTCGNLVNDHDSICDNIVRNYQDVKTSKNAFPALKENVILELTNAFKNSDMTADCLDTTFSNTVQNVRPT